MRRRAIRSEPLFFELNPRRVRRQGYSLPPLDVPPVEPSDVLPPELLRKPDPHVPDIGEMEVVQHFHRLSQLNYAVDEGLYPLGSCTMKYNPKVADWAAEHPSFRDLHPALPAEYAQGALGVLLEAEEFLCEITGMARATFQPPAGASGELTGLLIMRAYHQAAGRPRTTIVIPDSAHGTNPASVTLAGYKAVQVPSNHRGMVDLDALRGVLNEDVAGFMLTNPNTLGLFEEEISAITQAVHDVDGLMYYDGANLNAILGVSRPGDMGFDIVHSNLHKTFATPHGGGGPGVGPIAVKAHLAPFLPGHPLIPDMPGHEDGIGAVASAPWGSAGVLAISWAYIAMMGASGLRAATETAILNANYVAARLAPFYPVLYTGNDGLVAHECIIDIRDIQHDTGVTNEDVAKRLIDYGFHAPTMSFPVAGTLMIEPTESESKFELDRFCDAMVAIKGEIDTVASGTVAIEESVLRRSPHPAEDLLSDAWDRPYERETAAYPVDGLRRNKYWVPVSRIDNAFGDRHVVCACPPMTGVSCSPTGCTRCCAPTAATCSRSSGTWTAWPAVSRRCKSGE